MPCLRAHGFEGPLPGGKHQMMQKGARKLWIPNPHGGELSGPFIAEILRQAGIDLDDWQ